MTTTVYIDVLFLENFLLDFFILYITATVNNRKLKIMRGVMGSMLGAFYVCTLYISQANFYESVFVKFFMAVSIVFICFKIRSLGEFFKFFLSFITVNFILAGGIYFSQNILFESESKIKIISVFLGVLIIIFLGKGFFMQISDTLLKREFTKETLLFYNDKILRLKTFEDTGNSLVDPISKRSVVIISKKKAQEMTDISSISKIKNVRLIPCRTVLEKYELLYGFKPDKFIYNNKEIDAVIAISKEDFLIEGYDAIINPMTLI